MGGGGGGGEGGGRRHLMSYLRINHEVLSTQSSSDPSASLSASSGSPIQPRWPAPTKPHRAPPSLPHAHYTTPLTNGSHTATTCFSPHDHRCVLNAQQSTAFRCTEAAQSAKRALLTLKSVLLTVFPLTITLGVNSSPDCFPN